MFDDKTTIIAPTPLQQQTFRSLLPVLAQAQCPTSRQIEAAKALNYEFVHLSDSGDGGAGIIGLQPIFELKDHGWGSFFYKVNVEKRAIIEIVHPINDTFTAEIGARVFHHSAAHAYFISGGYRRAFWNNAPAGTDPHVHDLGNDGRADPPDLLNSIYNVVHRFASSGPYLTLQIHAFSNTTASKFPDNDAIEVVDDFNPNSNNHSRTTIRPLKAVISNGAGRVNPYCINLDRTIEKHVGRAGVFYKESPFNHTNEVINTIGLANNQTKIQSGNGYRYLAAARNIHGQEIRAGLPHETGFFCHLELSREARSPVLKQSATVLAISQAINQSVEDTRVISRDGVLWSMSRESNWHNYDNDYNQDWATLSDNVSKTWPNEINHAVSYDYEFSTPNSSSNFRSKRVISNKRASSREEVCESSSSVDLSFLPTYDDDAAQAWILNKSLAHSNDWNFAIQSTETLSSAAKTGGVSAKILTKSDAVLGLIASSDAFRQDAAVKFGVVFSIDGNWKIFSDGVAQSALDTNRRMPSGTYDVGDQFVITRDGSRYLVKQEKVSNKGEFTEVYRLSDTKVSLRMHAAIKSPGGKLGDIRASFAPDISELRKGSVPEISRTSQSNEWDYGFQSDSFVSANHDAFIRVKISEATSDSVFGFENAADTLNKGASISYGFRFYTDGTWDIYIDGKAVPTDIAEQKYGVNDEFRIERKGDEYLFRKGTALLHSVSGSSNTALKLHLAIRKGAGGFREIYSSFVDGLLKVLPGSDEPNLTRVPRRLNIDALYVFKNGDVAFSLSQDYRMGMVNYDQCSACIVMKNGAVYRYHRSGTYSGKISRILREGSATDGLSSSEDNIDGLHIVEDGQGGIRYMYISYGSDGVALKSPNGDVIQYEDGDIIKVTPSRPPAPHSSSANWTGELYLSEKSYLAEGTSNGRDEDINAITMHNNRLVVSLNSTSSLDTDSQSGSSNEESDDGSVLSHDLRFSDGALIYVDRDLTVSSPSVAPVANIEVFTSQGELFSNGSRTNRYHSDIGAAHAYSCNSASLPSASTAMADVTEKYSLGQAANREVDLLTGINYLVHKGNYYNPRLPVDTRQVTYSSVEYKYNGESWQKYSGKRSYHAPSRTGLYQFRYKKCVITELTGGSGEPDIKCDTNFTNHPNAQLLIRTPSWVHYTATSENGNVNLLWNDFDASQFMIAHKSPRSDLFINNMTQSNSFAKYNLSQGVHKFKVAAKFAEHVGEWSDVQSITVISKPAGVSTPQLSTDGVVKLKWDKSSIAANHYVQFRTKGGSWHSELTLSGGATSKVFEGLATGVYEFRVRSKIGDAYTDWAFANLTTVIRNPEFINVPTKSSTGKYTVSWSSANVSGAVSVLQRRLSGQNWRDRATLHGTSFSETGLSEGIYQYRLAFEIDGLRGGYLVSTDVEVSPQLPNQPGDGTVPEDIQLDDLPIRVSDKVGTLAGTGSVDGGQASYSIPIKVVPGRNGMQPNISLNYASNQGDGLLGVGWQLSAAAAITRCGRTTAQDGVNVAVRMDGNDKLCFNGKRLVTDGIYGQADTVYATELDDFARITQLNGDLASTKTYFKVELKSGRVLYFGKTADSRHSMAGVEATLTWSLSNEQDRSGNTITYSYTDVHSDNSEYLLNEIKYTGFGETQGTRFVSFDYQTKARTGLSYLAGGKRRSTRNLKSISTGVNATKARVYKLGYIESAASQRKLLETVTECGYVGDAEQCLPATTFNWQHAAPSFSLNPVSDTFTGEPSGYLTDVKWLHDAMPHGDINGDGVRDWPGLYINAEGEVTSHHNDELAACYRGTNAFSVVCLEVDFNVDGKTDSFRSYNKQLEIKASTSSSWTRTGIIWEDLYGHDGILGFSDFNGDALPDLAFKQRLSGQPSKLWVYLHTGNLNSPYLNTQRVLVKEYPAYDRNSVGINSTVFNDVINIEMLGDMDGNGTIDFMVTDTRRPDSTRLPGMPAPQEMILVEPNGTSFTTTTVSLPSVPHSETVNGNIFHDLNADGLLDWLNLTEDESWQYKLNKGGSFEGSWHALAVKLPVRRQLYARPSNPYEPEVSTYPVMSKITVMDYNGDGIQDLLVASAVQASSCSTLRSSSGDEWLCDDDLYGNYSKGSTGGMVDGKYTPIHSGLTDDSVRTFRALVFSIGENGVITGEYKGTSIKASATQRAVVDATGDGLPDIVTVFGCRFGQCEWNSETAGRSGAKQNSSYQLGAYINTNLGSGDGKAQDLIESVTNGLGHQQSWVYQSLSSDVYSTDNKPFYTATHSAEKDDKAYFNFASSMLVVAEHKTDNGVGGQITTKYRYKDAMYNNQGRGFQGFKSIIVEQDNFTDNDLDLVTRTDYHQKWPLTGVMKQKCTWLVSAHLDDNAACSAVIEHTVQSEISQLISASNAVRIEVGKTESTTYDLTDTTQVSKHTVVREFDASGYGNVTKQTETKEDEFGKYQTITKRVFDVDVESWWLTKYSSEEVTKKAVTESGMIAAKEGTNVDLKTSHSVSQWDDTHRLPKQIEVKASEATLQTKKFEYNSYGLVSASSTTANTLSGIEDKLTSVERSMRRTYTNDGISAAADGYFPYQETIENGTTDLVSTTHYNPMTGQATKTIDPNSVVIEMKYDAFGRVSETTSSGLKPRYTRYYTIDTDAPAHAVMRIVSSQAGQPSSQAYVDKLGRTVRTATEGFAGEWIFSDVAFDAVGNVTEEIGPYLANDSVKLSVTHSGFDALGRPAGKSTTQANGQSLDVAYEYSGLTTTISAEQLNMSRSYNSVGWLISTEDAINGMTQYAYNGAGLPIAIADPNNNTIYASYDAVGRKQWVSDPNQGKTTYTYNDFLEIEKEEDANKDVVRYDYDLAGRITQRHDTGRANASVTKATVSASFVFDSAQPGLLKTANYGGIKESFGYDSYGRVITKTTEVDSHTFTYKNHYDGLNGRLKALEYPNNFVVGYEYNDQGYVSREYNPSSDYTYRKITAKDAFNNITAALLANGEMTGEYGYANASGQMMLSKVSSNSGVIHHLSYDAYDDFGNLKGYTNHIHDYSERYEYDALHRIKNMAMTVNNLTANVAYEYDSLGNLTKKSDYASKYTYADNRPNAVASVLKVNGQVANFGYDNKGNLTSGEGRALWYNVHNKPVKITQGSVVSQFHYAAGGHRVKQQKVQADGSESTVYYLDKLFEQEASSGNTIWRAYISDVAILSYDSSVKRYQLRFTHKDRLGSTTTLSDEVGNVMAYRNFDVFGKPRGGDGQVISPAKLSGNVLDLELFSSRGFTDHEHLDELALIHMNGRVYDYNLGRFMSVDPVIQSPTNSQSINPYSYIMNNPLAGVDPTGYSSCRPEDSGGCQSEPKPLEIVITGGKNKGESSSSPNAAGGDIGRKGNSDNPNAPIANSSKSSMPSNGNENTQKSQGKIGSAISDIGSPSTITNNRSTAPSSGNNSSKGLFPNIPTLPAPPNAKNHMSGMRSALGYVQKYGMNVLQTIGGSGQALLGASLMSNPITFIPGALILAHGLFNTAQGVGLTESNYAQEGWRYALGEQYGDYAYFGVDIASAGWAALGRKIGQFGLRASGTNTIHHSKNLTNSLGRDRIHFRGDYVRNYRTVSGASLAINDGLVIQYGMRNNAN
ncbi:hypothetical protein L1D50_16905 [Pseudoalteromonas sp. Isolate6]|uniref:SpvB/TcaC N-terminal domain-containing protein n=1 Tax=Pseudoalteromonas sp. Isolate6 TaxID=2908527 RepID=UPI001EFDDB3F|nr:SpvB/TcaC N-terminal domain-containing protein [Pseudoalteromonas sp. Isolate6]MCG9760780.1 hypothetical protein [Pseudoalteromonas sp. Isolate6]